MSTIDGAVDRQTPASDSLADELILMSILLMRFSVRTGGVIENDLRTLADDLVRLLVANDFSQMKMESAKRQRLLRLLEEAELAIRDAFAKTGRGLMRDVRMAIEAAGEHAALAINTTLGFERAEPPTEQQVIAMAAALLVDGKSPVDWWKRLAGDIKFRFVRIIQDGYQRKMPLEQMIAAIRGTGEKQFNDGFLASTWRAAAKLANSAVLAGSSVARQHVWERNGEAVNAIQQISVLDFRTSAVCRKYHGAIWSIPTYEPVGHGLPYNGGVPRHWNCRSIEVPIVRPYDDLPPRFQARIAFQKRKAAFDGAEPADLSYEDWLKAQSVLRQKAALGGRYEIWKTGKLTLEDMLDHSGSPLTIRELRKLAGLA